MSAKGSSYERDLCRRLSLWWSEGEHDDLIWRTAGSGGRATVRRKAGRRTVGHCGDLCATDPAAEALFRVFTFELKRGYGNANPFDLLDRREGMAVQTFEKFVVQAEASRAAADSLYWCLIHKRDRRESMVYVTKEAYLKFFALGSSWYTGYRVLFLSVVLSNRKVLRLAAMPLEQFLKLPPRVVKKLV